MSQYRNLTRNQEDFLIKCWDILNGWYLENKRNPIYYNWDVYKEMRFINKVLNDGEYDLYYDADRLNSLGNLYRYLKVKI
jgi:hypothetical protein